MLAIIRLAHLQRSLPSRFGELIAKIQGKHLLPVLRSAHTCLYYPHNMHWLAMGHRIVADYLVTKFNSEAFWKRK